MRRSFLLAIPILLVAGCTSRVDKLEQQYDMMERTRASKTELCRQSRKVVQALLEAGDEKAYSERKARSDITCMSAEYGPE